jgi:4-amino-4-deoxy-L-arabinose transferase-like glycosyltransferase
MEAVRPPLLPLLVCLAALALRLWGIGWGLPDAAHAFSYHPDESLVVSAALVTNPFLLLLDSGFYNYGEAAILMFSKAIHIGAALGLVAIAPGAVPSASALLAARLTTALLGAGTCALLFGTGRRLFGTPAGTVAALAYALAPLAVQHGHFATVDVPATFFIAATLWLLSTDLKRRWLLCGLVAGLAAATKYNAGLVLLAPLCAWALSRPRSGKDGASLAGGAALGFLLGCPGALLNPTKFVADLTYEANHARTGSGDIFQGTPIGFVYHGLVTLPWGLGWPLVLLVLYGVVQAARRRSAHDLALAAFALPYFVLIGIAQIKFARYTLPLYPPLLLWAGAAVGTGRYGRPAATVALTAALLMTLAFDSVLAGPDPRDRAAAYLTAQAPASVGFATGPWWYSPPLDPGISHPIPPQAKRAAAERTATPRLIPADGAWNAAQLAETRPDAVALSEFEYADALRLRRSAAQTYLAALRTALPTRHVFASPLRVLGVPLTRTAGDLPVQNLPHDMLYPNPTTVIFTR